MHTFDGEASYGEPDLRHDDDAYMICEHCGKSTYMGDRFCGSCGELPVHTFDTPSPTIRANAARDCDTIGCLVIGIGYGEDE